MIQPNSIHFTAFVLLVYQDKLLQHLEIPADKLLKELVDIFEKRSNESITAKKLVISVEFHITLYKEIKEKGLITSNMLICLLDAILNSKNPRIKQVEELIRDLQEISEKTAPSKAQNSVGIPSLILGGSHLRDACLKKVSDISIG